MRDFKGENIRKVLLVANPKLHYGFDLYARVPNLAICSLAANIDRNLFDVQVVDLVVKKKKAEAYFEKLINKIKPDVIGLSTMTFQYQAALNLAKLIKNINPGIITVLGGYHPTVDSENILKSDAIKYFDFLVRGEGEIPFSELLLALRNNKPLSDVNGISYKDGDEIINNPTGCLIKLEDLKYPDRSVRIIKNGFHFNGLKADVVETSRGCVFDCNFCSINLMYGKSFRKFTIERTINDIKNAKQFGAKAIAFADDNITLDWKRLKALCEAITENKLNDIKYFLQASIQGLRNSDGLIPAMAKAGVKWVFLGIESSEDSALAALNKEKQFKTNETKEVIQELKRNNILTIGGFVLGLPEDTEKSMRANFGYGIDLGIDIPIWNVLTPYPNTGIREEMLKDNLITNIDDYEKYDCWEVNTRTKYLSTEDIYRIKKDMEVKFPSKSGGYFRLMRHFPYYYTRLMFRLFFEKPSDFFRIFRHFFKTENRKNRP